MYLDRSQASKDLSISPLISWPGGLGNWNSYNEPDEIIVVGKVLPGLDLYSSGFSATNFFYGVHWGDGTTDPDPFGARLIPISQGLSANELVARTCESLALAIETVTNLARVGLPRSEEARLDALSEGLKYTALALKAGQIDMSSAKAALTTSLATALDGLGGLGMGILFSGLGSWATALVPNPALKALGTFGFGLIGLAVDWYVSDFGAANFLATEFVDSLFAGAEAFGQAIYSVIDQVQRGINPITGTYDPFQQETSIFLQSNGVMGEFDNDYSNGTESYVPIFHNGVGTGYLFTTNTVLNVPSSWPGYTGPGPDTPPMPEEPPAIIYNELAAGCDSSLLLSNMTLSIAAGNALIMA